MRTLALVLLAACGIPNTPFRATDDGGVGDGTTSAQGSVSLDVALVGAGTSVVTSLPDGIQCGASCTARFPVGTLVTLTELPGTGAMFAGWTGGCTGATATCSVTLEHDTQITATFAPTQHTVTLALAGNGAGGVTSTPGGIACPGTCTTQLPYGTHLQLVATTQGTSRFVGWSGGGCSGTADCAIDITSNATINASFALDYSLVVTRTGAGSGTVTSSPAGISCGTDCSQVYAAGTTVTLTAAPAADSLFTGWSGACSGTGSCQVTIDMAKMVTASFDLKKFALTVAKAGNGAGTIASNPAGISCGGTCSAQFATGTSVTLTATPATGSTFSGWSGACAGTGTCTVAMTQAQSVTATFTLGSYTLTVMKAGTGVGTVTSSPAGISCGATCSAQYLYNTFVTLTAAAAAGNHFVGWSGGGCTGTSPCVVPVTAAITVVATFDPPPNVMFVTSTTTSANIGGLAGADTLCQQRAQAAGLAGTYRAWLSTSTTNAIDRITGSGWVRTDGLPFVNTKADLANMMLFSPPRFDEHGTDIGDQFVFTGTSLGGVYDSDGDCNAWTSNASSTNGVAAGTSAGASYMAGIYYFLNCNQTAHLYCFGIDRMASVVPPPVTGVRRAFAMHWTPGGGLASADAACATAATAAGLPGSFKALLATSGASALSRFDLSGPPWYRVDNMAILPTAQAWASASFLVAGSNLSADGQMLFGNYINWNGASSLTAPGTAASTCSSWTDTSATATAGITGSTNIAQFFFAGNNPVQCNFTSATITCLQQ